MIKSDIFHRNSCEGNEIRLNTFIGEGCGMEPYVKPLTSFNASAECADFFDIDGFFVLAEVVACIEDGEDVTNITKSDSSDQEDDDDDESGICWENMIMSFMMVVIGLMSVY